jgi:hypothetical protein
MHHQLKRIFGSLVPLFLSFASHLHAQISTASVTGTVVDSSSAAIADTSVKLVNIQTGTENDSRTGRDGRFTLPGVLPGDYALQIERQGFATIQLSGIALNVGDTKNLLIRMRVGSVTESVNVDASGLTLNTSDGTVSTVVDRNFVTNVPLNGRSFQDLISMTPGVVTQSPQASGETHPPTGDFGVNGQLSNANSFFVDGVSANVSPGISADHSRLSILGSGGGATALGTTQSLVSIDALQEFRVLSSSYSAEYGRTPGGQFTFLTRSGTDQLHGSAYIYWRNYVADSTDWFGRYDLPSGTTKPSFSQEDFGGTFGTPIRFWTGSAGHDATFVFASYEGLLLAQPTPTSILYIPSNELVFSAPSPVANMLYYFSGGDGDVAQGPFVLSPALSGSYSLPARVNSLSLRVDHTASSKLSLFVRYGDTPSSSEADQLSSFTTDHAHTRTLTLGATGQMSPTMSNDILLGFIRSNADENTNTGGLGGGYSYMYPFQSTLGDTVARGPIAADAYIHIAGIGDTEVSSNNFNSVLSQWNLRDTFNLQAAQHSFKFGIDQRHLESTLTPDPLSIEADFFDAPSLLNNQASAVVITKNLPASPVINQFSAFAQDEWHASPPLTLSLGLRWDVNPAPNGEHGADAFTAVGDIESPANITLARRGTPLWHTNWLNLAPRFGAAWKITDHPGRETVLRAGAGLFYDTGDQGALPAFQGLGFTTSSVEYNAPIPVPSDRFQFSSALAAPYTTAPVYLFPSHRRTPYSLEWNVGLERAVGKDQSLTVSYVGAEGEHLLQEQRRDINSFNPSFGELHYFPSGIDSNYQSLQLRFQRSISHSVQTLAGYTWAHSIDYGSVDPYYPLVRGNSDLDVRQNLEGALTWSMPQARGSFLRRALLGGWGADGRVIARSGFPVTLLGDLFSAPLTGGRYYNGVNLVPGRPLYLYGAQYPGGRILNGGPNVSNPAFTLPDGVDAGDAPRNLARGFNAVQVNLSAQRDIEISSKLNVRFRVEAFNILNHPNFGYVDPSVTDALFGQATKMLNESFGPGGALYQQGGPRSIQLSVRGSF